MECRRAVVTLRVGRVNGSKTPLTSVEGANQAGLELGDGWAAQPDEPSVPVHVGGHQEWDDRWPRRQDLGRRQCLGSPGGVQKPLQARPCCEVDCPYAGHRRVGGSDIWPPVPRQWPAPLCPTGPSRQWASGDHAHDGHDGHQPRSDDSGQEETLGPTRPESQKSGQSDRRYAPEGIEHLLALANSPGRYATSNGQRGDRRRAEIRQRVDGHKGNRGQERVPDRAITDE